MPVFNIKNTTTIQSPLKPTAQLLLSWAGLNCDEWNLLSAEEKIAKSRDYYYLSNLSGMAPPAYSESIVSSLVDDANKICFVNASKSAPSGAPLSPPSASTPMAVSTFNGIAVRSLWFRNNSRAGRAPTICGTTGSAMLFDLQTKMRERLSATGPIATQFGPASAASLSGSSWNRATLVALYALAARDHAPASALSAIAADIHRSSGPLSPLTAQTAIWEAWLNEADNRNTQTGVTVTVYTAGSPSEVQFPEGTIYPSFGSTPPTPVESADQTGFSCGPATGFDAWFVPQDTNVLNRYSGPLMAAFFIASAWTVAYLVRPPKSRRK